MKRSFLCIFVLFFGLSLWSCGDGTPERASQARPYIVVGSSDFSFPGRKRVTYSIVAEHAAIAIERADTVVVAAKELAEESGADVVEVWLDPSKALAGKGLSLALARYAVGGGGLSGDQNWKWEVRVSDQIISKQECRIEEAWWNHRDSFQKDGGGTDETALKKYISETFGVPFESVTPLWVERNITYGVTEK